MIFVIPAFQGKCSRTGGGELPVPAVVIAMSEFSSVLWYLIFGGIFGGVYFFMEAWYNEKMNIMDRVLLKLPFWCPVPKSVSPGADDAYAVDMFAGVPPGERWIQWVAHLAIRCLSAPTRGSARSVGGTRATCSHDQYQPVPVHGAANVRLGEFRFDRSHVGRPPRPPRGRVDDMVAGISSLMGPSSS
jgi:type IV pilus assembly protein PilC